MIKKSDRINWLIKNQEMWKHIPSEFPQEWVGQKEIRKVAQAMIEESMFSKQALSMLEVPVLNLIKQCRKILPQGSSR